MYETGQFATLWQRLAAKFGIDTEFIKGDWRSGVDVAAIEQRLVADKGARDQGRVRRAQRDLDGHHLRYRRRCARRWTGPGIPRC